MIDKLKKIENRYDELTAQLSDPEIIGSSSYLEMVKEHSDLEPVISLFKEYTSVKEELEENKGLLSSQSESEFRELVKEEIDIQEKRISSIENELAEMLTPRDPNDLKNVIMEIRGGAGGEEAALFAAVLFKMYSYYASSKGWSTDIIDLSETELGGIKEIVFSIDGKGAYSKLKYERGVHRVQRVPATESGGRIHTSTVTVAVLPEAEDVDVHVDMNDIDMDTYRASGAGGQHINKTDSAIRLTHRPTGIVVTCQDQRSQHKNKEKALSVLRSRIYEMEQSKQTGAIANERKSQVGTGDRSERIRTYNYHQGRVTDHRIGLTLYKIDEILQGGLDEFISALSSAEKAEELAGNKEMESFD